MTLHGLKRRYVYLCVNKLYAGTRSKHFEKKRRLLNSIGYQIGEGSKVVGPIFCTGKLIVGKDCWLGRNLKVCGNGTVVIGDNCDIAPEVLFQTGSHEIGGSDRRAGTGINKDIEVGNGCWLGVRTTVLGGVKIGSACMVGACALVNKDIEENTLVGGVPAREIKKLPYE